MIPTIAAQKDGQHPLLSQLRSLVGEPDFDVLFCQLTADQDSNQRASLRQELRRLASCCLRPLDLRTLGFKDTQPVKVANLEHHLDPGGQRLLRQGLREFRGRYTLAIYEDVMAYARHKQGQDSPAEGLSWLPVQPLGPAPDHPGPRAWQQQLESLALAQSDLLPLFYQGQPGQWQLSHCLSRPQNRNLLSHFAQGEHSLLPALLAPLVDQLYDQEPGQRQLFLLSFSHSHRDQRHLFAATLTQLVADGRLGLFLGQGAKKPHWKILKLSLFEVEACQWQGLDKPSELALDELQPVPTPVQAAPRLLVTLQDVSLPFLPLPQGQSADPAPLMAYHLSQASPLPVLAMRFANMRLEPRYQLRSQVQLTLDGQPYQATSVDISSQGLCLDLDKPLHRVPQEVDLALPRLQQLTSRYNLSALPYQVVQYDAGQQRLHLMVAKRDSPHPAPGFFSALIAANQSRLPIVEEAHSHFALATELSQLLGPGLPTALVVEQRQGTITPGQLAMAFNQGPLATLVKRLLQRDGQLALSPLLDKGQFQQLLRDSARQGQHRQLLLLALDKDGLPRQSRLHSQLPGNELSAFLAQARQQGSWQAWLLQPHRVQAGDRSEDGQAPDAEPHLDALALVEITEVSQALAAVLGLTAPR